jgi:hypothetical protein
MAHDKQEQGEFYKAEQDKYDVRPLLVPGEAIVGLPNLFAQIRVVVGHSSS